jgi:nitroimidazol reductase NimA-like FMN-containing flavoprotein (pyridoxamine 5'-phosphate oxidase superfamily)
MVRTEVSRLREKQVRDRQALDALLDGARVGHVGVVRADGTPFVVPTAIARADNTLLVHGSGGSPWMRRVAEGAPVCVTVTELDGLVLARSAFESSLHYRSAVLFGVCTPITDDDAKTAALDHLTEALIPGRLGEVRRPIRRELAATSVLALPITEWSLKVSAGWPEDPPDDVAGPAWAGVVPMRTSYAPPAAAPDLRAGIDVPESVRRLNG